MLRAAAARAGERRGAGARHEAHRHRCRRGAPARAARCRSRAASRGRAALIQSVVQAGARRMRRRAPGPRPAASIASSDALLDHLGRRAAGVGRRDDDLEPVVVLDHVAHDAEVAHRDAGTSGSSTPSQHLPGALDARARSAARRSPHAPGKAALQVLHLGQDVAQVLAVHAALAGAAERADRPAAPGRPRRATAATSRAPRAPAGRTSAGRGRSAAAASSTASVSNSSAM